MTEVERIEQQTRIEAVVTDVLDVLLAHRVSAWEAEVAIGEAAAEFFVACGPTYDERLEQWCRAVRTRVAQMKAARVERVM